MIKDILENNEKRAINADKIEKIKEIVPGCFDKDGKFDIELLKNELTNSVDYTKDNFELNFLGKSYAKMITSFEPETVIQPDLIHNQKLENINSKNIYISGDNLEALKHLLKSYEASIKCIYIDPPYNTGNDDFVYNDNFNFSIEDLQSKLEINENEAKRILSMTTTESSSHSAWLTFMYPRLYYARQLLNDEGIIFISIDDNEEANLKLLCDSIFGEENFIANMVNLTGANQSGDGVNIQKNWEYCLVYSKNSEIANIIRVQDVEKKYRALNDAPTPLETRPDEGYTIYYNPNTEDMIAKFDYDKTKIHLNDENKVYKNDEELISKGYIPIRPGIRGNTKKLHRWRWGIDTFNARKKEIKIFKTTSGYSPRFLQKGLLAPPNITKFSTGTSELTKIFDGKKVFNYPKSVAYISYLSSLATEDGDIILDFFGGSATTAHAIMQRNANENKNIKYIIVQLQEDLEKNYNKANSEGKKLIKTQIDFLNSLNKPLYLDELGQERIKRAAQKIKSDTKANIDYGFKHYILKETSLDTLSKLENFKPELINDTYNLYKEYGTETIIETWKLKDGYTFDINVEKIDLGKYTAYKCNDCLYFINPSIKIENIKNLLERFNDNSFYFNKLIIFGYSFMFNEIEMIKNNLKQFKHIDIKVYTRY